MNWPWSEFRHWQGMSPQERWAEASKWVQDKVEEGIHLEFKGCKGPNFTKDDQAVVARAVCALANVEGGLVLVGAESKKTDSNAVDYLSGFAVHGAPIPSVVDALEKRLANLLSPRLPGLAFLPVFDPTALHHGAVAISVPESYAGPHRVEGVGGSTGMAGRYFMRTGAASVVVPHVVLAAMFGRRPAPRLRIWLQRSSANHMVAFVENVGKGLARGCRVVVEFALAAPDGVTEIGGFGERFSRFDPRPRNGGNGLRGIRANSGHPLFPNDSDKLCVIGLNPGQTFDGCEVSGRLDADDTFPIYFRGPVPPVGEERPYPADDSNDGRAS